MTKESWDELQQLVLISGAILMWGGFEILCFLNPEYAATPDSTAKRHFIEKVVLMIVTYVFTRSFPGGGGRFHGHTK